VAARNASNHGVADRVRFLEGDLFGPLTAVEKFQFILSNPPYIAHGELAGLARDVRDFEPHLALDGGPTACAFLIASSKRRAITSNRAATC